MVIIESYTTAVFMCIITMLCWGSWANTQKLASKEWKFQLFYWDYCIGILLMTLILAFTMGSMGEQGRSFMADMGQADSANLLNPILGGIIFNLETGENRRFPRIRGEYEMEMWIPPPPASTAGFTRLGR